MRTIVPVLVWLICTAPALSASPDKKLDQSLIKAVKKSNSEKVAARLLEGADPNARDKKGQVALDVAAGLRDGKHRVKEQRVLFALLEGGADLSHMTKEPPRYLLTWAIDNDREDVMDVVVARHDSHDLRLTGVAHALYDGKDRYFRSLAEGLDLNRIDENGETILTKVFRRADRDGGKEPAELIPLLRRLRELGLALPLLDGDGRSALELAAESPAYFQAILATIAEATAEIDRCMRVEPELTSVRRAGLEDSSLATKLREVWSDRAMFQRALLAAAAAGQVDVGSCLLRLGADPTITDAEGDTPLHAAGRAGSFHFVKLLLDCEGCEVGVNVPNSLGETPLMLAAAAEKYANERLLRQQLHLLMILVGEGEGNDPRSAAASDTANLISDFRSTVAYLLAAGADPNAADQRARTPLHRAAESYLPENVRLLLEAGADPSARDTRGLDVYQTAQRAEHRHSEIVATLAPPKP